MNIFFNDLHLALVSTIGTTQHTKKEKPLIIRGFFVFDGGADGTTSISLLCS
jgi:hypothetical protein